MKFSTSGILLALTSVLAVLQGAFGSPFPAPERRITYPSKSQIAEVFSAIEGPNANYTKFFSQVSPSVNWTIEGTHPAAGIYTNRTILAVTFARLASVARKEDPLELTLLNIIGGDNEEWSVQELEVNGICKSGRSKFLIPAVD